jgi:hypothetical protein
MYRSNRKRYLRNSRVVALALGAIFHPLHGIRILGLRWCLSPCTSVSSSSRLARRLYSRTGVMISLAL